MFKIALSPKQVRLLKAQVLLIYQMARHNHGGDLAKGVLEFATSVGFYDVEGYALVAVGLITGYDYDQGNPNGGGFIKCWRKFLDLHVNVVKPARLLP